MAKNPVVHRVRFKNETPETVTFVVETRSGPQSSFTLKPQESRFEDVHSETYRTLTLVVGENSNGHCTNESISSDELTDLDEVAVVVKNPGNNSVNNFILKTTRRYVSNIKSWVVFSVKLKIGTQLIQSALSRP